MSNPTTKADNLHVTLANQYEYEGIDADAVDDLVTSALTDLRHLCDKHSLDFGRLNRKAQNHYVKEI